MRGRPRDAMLLSMVIACTVFGCTGEDPGGFGSNPDPTDPTDPVAPPPEDLESVPGIYLPDPDDTGEEVEQSPVFDDEVVHEFQLQIPQKSWQSLSQGGGWGSADNTYYPATFRGLGQELEVGIRLKGSSTWQSIGQKPNWKIKFDEFVPKQELEDVDAFDMHNEIYDPSFMKEHLAYKTFRDAGLPASRTGWAHLTVNGTDYGLYALIEKEDGRYLEQWFDDTTGSVYESVGCDVNQQAQCWELDRDGEGDDPTAFQALHAAASTSSEKWYEAIQTVIDWDVVIRSLTLEIAIAHWDGYSGNLNNIRIYHEPTVDRWYYTPWSTDLAFGSYPWFGATPFCGNYGEMPGQYNRGILVNNCKDDDVCRETFSAGLMAAADHIEAMDLVTEIDRVGALLRAYAVADPKSPYDEAQFDAEMTCLKDWITGRPDTLRDGAP